ncbi:hypothetical protein ATE84_3170 [Aquimarina sp. MAR_2010_214]|uniref:hypothetical protein n=1 Tax=Aquimarina sp. MAR_2010_214 TaxID=1250026 RepID=UPI000C710BDD|nr:hypothetical protein [Aquimarina sp. MAR_2010_214]PKV51101.1 hypothetical protein ATE84_3170 [Aquimarina sp. MAR_2010_214]
MKLFFTILIAGIGFSSYGQENVIHAISIKWEQLSAPLSITKNEHKIEKYQLQKVDLTIDLRQQAFKKSYTMYIDTPKYKDISSKYNVTTPQPKTSGFRVYGNGYTPNTNIGGIKNTAYKDASLYRGTFYPITGLTY